MNTCYQQRLSCQRLDASSAIFRSWGLIWGGAMSKTLLFACGEGINHQLELAVGALRKRFDLSPLANLLGKACLKEQSIR